MTLGSVKEIAKLLGRSLRDERLLTKAYVDGRLCEEGGLYFALKGVKSHGHDFLEQAAKKGAIAAVVEEGYEGEDFGLTLIRVEDPLIAMQYLAKSFIKERKPFVVGITGSIGKTTVKEFLATLLETSYVVSRTPNSYNGQIGLPLTILNADPEAEVLVLEMGMSYKGDMKNLLEIVKPHVAIMTRIAPAHIGHFSSLEEIAEEKATILHEDLTHAFIHEGNKHYTCILKDHSFKKSFYGRGQEMLCELPFSETHLVENFSIAAMVAKYLNVEKEEIEERARYLKPFKHRFEKLVLKTYPKSVVVDDSYNNNPFSLKTSLQNLPKPQRNCKTLAILGEMRELGSLSKMAHEEVAVTALPIVDVLICYGEETKPLYEVFKQHQRRVYHTVDKGSIKELIIKNLEDGDVVFFKGANSNKLWEVLDQISDI